MRLVKIQETQVLWFFVWFVCLFVFPLNMMAKLSVDSVGAGLCCPKGLTTVQLWGWELSPSSGAEGDRKGLSERNVLLYHLPPPLLLQKGDLIPKNLLQY